MSKLGKKGIYLPQLLKTEVQTYQNGQIFWISGPNATLFRYTDQQTAFVIRTNHLSLRKTAVNSVRDFYQLLKTRAIQKQNQYSGLLQGQLQKSIFSAITGYKKYLTLRGVGYKFQKKNRYFTLQIGYSHKINILIPSDIQMKFNRKLTGILFQNYNDAFLYGWLSSIRNAKKPDVYKGKGIRYKKDTTIRKEGKKKKTF